MNSRDPWPFFLHIDRLIAMRILVMAVLDATGPTRLDSGEDPDLVKNDARQWLLSGSAEMVIEDCGIDPETVHRWVSTGCPVPDNWGDLRMMRSKSPPSVEVENKEISQPKWITRKKASINI